MNCGVSIRPRSKAMRPRRAPPELERSWYFKAKLPRQIRAQVCPIRRALTRSARPAAGPAARPLPRPALARRRASAAAAGIRILGNRAGRTPCQPLETHAPDPDLSRRDAADRMRQRSCQQVQHPGRPRVDPAGPSPAQRRPAAGAGEPAGRPRPGMAGQGPGPPDDVRLRPRPDQSGLRRLHRLRIPAEGRALGLARADQRLLRNRPRLKPAMNPVALHYRPPAPLSAYVDLFWYYTGFARGHAKERLLPTGTTELVINLHEDEVRTYDTDHFERCFRHPGSVVVGVHNRYFVLDTEEQANVIGIHFRPGGAFPFLAPPADDFRNAHVDLEAVWGPEARHLRERLLAAATPEGKFAVLEKALLARLGRASGPHGAVLHALRSIDGAPHLHTIGRLTERLGLSPKRFIQLFAQQVGLTPKVYC